MLLFKNNIDILFLTCQIISVGNIRTIWFLNKERQDFATLSC